MIYIFKVIWPCTSLAGKPGICRFLRETGRGDVWESNVDMAIVFVKFAARFGVFSG